MENKSYSKSLLVGAAFFILALVINYFASMYAAERVSHPVTDIILSNVPVKNVNQIIIYTTLVLLIIGLRALIKNPKMIPYVLKSLALFIVIRAVFITLTHLGPFAPQLALSSNLIASVGLGGAGDLFFSGHTGMPFLLALVFWEHKPLRVVFLAGSLILGVSVLLGHLHYSIDVLAAYFITYTIFHLSKIFFADDWNLFNSKPLKEH
ncbi:MAG TPA: phosphatase PAP2-related protein [Patescibacteria group bacterium]